MVYWGPIFSHHRLEHRVVTEQAWTILDTQDNRKRSFPVKNLSHLICNVSNGWFWLFEVLLIVKSTVDLVEIFQSLSYKRYSIFLWTLAVFVLFILVMGVSAIILQTNCCYAVTTSKICLQRNIELLEFSHAILEHFFFKFNFLVSQHFLQEGQFDSS